MKKIDFYFDIIDGKKNADPSMFKGEPTEHLEGLILEYAFDSIIEIGDKNCLNKLVSYIDKNIDEYGLKKNMALMNVGYIADQEIEPLLIQYLDSKNPDLRFSSFCSICEIAKRQVISTETIIFFIAYIEEKLANRTISHEEVIEVSVMLNDLNIPQKDELSKLLLKNYPDAVKDAEQFF